jgi:hypothetical protein
MKAFLVLTMLLTLVALGQDTITTSDSSPLIIQSYKCSKSHQVPEKTDVQDNAPARAVITTNKNFQRNVRVNDPVGARDPNLDTVDGRSAAMDKNVQESRTAPPKAVDGFSYKVKMQNSSAKPVEIVFWEYQFIDPSNTATMARRQFLCGVKIPAGKAKEVQAFSLSGPSEVVSIDSLANKPASGVEEKAIINRVEYSDGTIWQRKDWNFGEIRLTYRRATSTPWGSEMCRGL